LNTDFNIIFSSFTFKRPRHTTQTQGAKSELFKRFFLAMKADENADCGEAHDFAIGAFIGLRGQKRI
jgi:2-phospho-L-lactate guanylyltransferase (CobY/MobA/RfbA family)